MIAMKKSWSVIAIIVLALIFGILIGFKLFQSQKSDFVVKKSPQKVSESASIETQDSKKSGLKRKQVKARQSGKEAASLNDLKDILERDLRDLDQQCESEFQAIYPTDDFLDQESKVFSSAESYAKGLMVLNAILDKVELTHEFDARSDNIYLQDDFDPNLMRTLMPHGIVCNDVRYTNLMHALVRSLGRNTGLSQEKKRIFVLNILNMAERYVYGFKRMEYTFSAMEYLYALVDNELISREYSGELAQIRQDIIRYTQDFEGDYRLENSADGNRELLRTYRDANEQTNESIELLIERVRADIPG